MRLKILHVVGRMNRGGTETLIMNLYRKIDKNKIQFDFIVHDDRPGDYDEEIKSMGGRIYHISKYNGVNHFSYTREWNFFFQNHPEHHIVHGHMRSTASIYLNLAKKYHKTTIAHSHSTSSRGNCIEKIVKNILQYPIRYSADYFLACSIQAGLWLFGKKICRSSNFWILNNAIDSSKFIYQEDIRQQIRKELKIKEEFVIGHIGNFDPTKNHSFLIDIFNNICKKDDECLLILIGGGDIELQKCIYKQAQHSNITTKIKFLGVCENINELLNAFDIFILPSLHEGLGIAAIEAQANGLKCILSDTIPTEVKITKNVEFISLKKNASFWAKRILSYKNKDTREDMHEKIINAGYDIYSVVQWLTKFYINITKE